MTSPKGRKMQPCDWTSAQSRHFQGNRDNEIKIHGTEIKSMASEILGHLHAQYSLKIYISKMEEKLEDNQRDRCYSKINLYLKTVKMITQGGELRMKRFWMFSQIFMKQGVHLPTFCLHSLQLLQFTAMMMIRQQMKNLI